VTSQAVVGWVFRDEFFRHRTRPGHPDHPARLDVIVQALGREGMLERMRSLRFQEASFQDLVLVHEPAYVELVRMACEGGFGYIGDPDTHIGPESYRVAALATGGVLAACDAVMAGEVRRAFCAVRPPGHHAGADAAGGFCLFNHVAVAAEHLRTRRGLDRVAVVDLDVHHGNGTQALFEDQPGVLFVSVHEHPMTLKFPGTGWPGEAGRGRGAGFTRNVCVPHGADGSVYRRVLEREVLPLVERYRPQFLLVSMGFDAQWTEPLAHVNLRPEDFGWITRALVEAADALCDGRLVSVLEGGYELRTLGHCAVEHVRGLLGPSGVPDRLTPIGP